MSRDVKWMEWHGRQTAEDDLALFDEVTKIKEDSVILEQEPTSFTIPYAETDTFLEDISVPPLSTLPTPDPATVPTTTTRLRDDSKNHRLFQDARHESTQTPVLQHVHVHE
jgi:hypothetical protein